MTPLSLVQQNYIETIYSLCMEHGHAHTKDIAEALHIRMASATEVMQALSASGYINYNKRRAVTLTDKGLEIARELHRRHSILADFFRMIGCPEDLAEEAACKVEHNIDGNIAAMIEKHIQEYSANA